MNLVRIGGVLILWLAFSTVIFAQDSTAKLSEKIDELIKARLEREQLSPSPPADDSEFLRRVYVDLTGCIPSASAAAAFIDDERSTKREQLVDELLASPGYGEHFADLWCNLLLDEDVVYGYIRQPNVDALRAWFADQFNRNRPWDAVVRDLLSAEGPLEQHPQAIFFELNANQSITPQPALLAKSAARLFLGQQIQCAECHDHPFREVTQQDYWGLAAFFSRLHIGKMSDAKDSPVVVTDAPAGFVIKSNNIGDRKVLNEPAIAIADTAFQNVGTVVNAKLLGTDTPSPTMDRPLRPVLA
jgi:hypothetical protein